VLSALADAAQRDGSARRRSRRQTKLRAWADAYLAESEQERRTAEEAVVREAAATVPAIDPLEIMAAPVRGRRRARPQTGAAKATGKATKATGRATGKAHRIHHGDGAELDPLELLEALAATLAEDLASFANAAAAEVVRRPGRWRATVDGIDALAVAGLDG
jgi:hypothetical protein